METEKLIDDLINQIVQGQTTNAQNSFDALISSKLQTALDDKKIEVAQSIYNTDSSNSEEEEEEEINPELEHTNES